MNEADESVVQVGGHGASRKRRGPRTLALLGVLASDEAREYQHQHVANSICDKYPKTSSPLVDARHILLHTCTFQ